MSSRDKTILHVVGARPNYMKIAPLMDALSTVPRVRQLLVNTGQHYDAAMAGGFIRELSLPIPDRDLEVGSASHAVQTANVMIRFEQVCLEEKPDLVVVVGDVNSTMAATLVASKLLIPVAHVEAGLRSFDRTMPEEINRVVTDRLADILLTPSRDADENLAREGVAAERVYFVGNIMIDTLFRHLPTATLDRVADRVNVTAGSYAVLTLHRPSNVDVRETFTSILSAVAAIASETPVVFPMHPRTQARVNEFGLRHLLKGVCVLGPMGYIDFLSLTSHAKVVLTDSGGIQEETTYLGIPCLTLRENTERPITVKQGTNRLVRPETVHGHLEAILSGKWPKTTVPPLWDGKTADRVARSLKARAT